MDLVEHLNGGVHADVGLQRSLFSGAWRKTGPYWYLKVGERSTALAFHVKGADPAQGVLLANDIGEGDAEQQASLAIPQGFQLPYVEVDLFFCAPFSPFCEKLGVAEGHPG